MRDTGYKLWHNIIVRHAVILNFNISSYCFCRVKAVPGRTVRTIWTADVQNATWTSTPRTGWRWWPSWRRNANKRLTNNPGTYSGHAIAGYCLCHNTHAKVDDRLNCDNPTFLSLKNFQSFFWYLREIVGTRECAQIPLEESDGRVHFFSSEVAV